MITTQHYDICIIGSGPAGLACLSAIREPYSLDILNEDQITRANVFLKGDKREQLSVCIIDPHPCWMRKWKESFDRLRIQYLRSPVIAHPDLFDTNGLLAYAIENGREDELYETGLFDMKSLFPLGQSQIGLWKLPSTDLFNDFCDRMSERLQHDYIQGKATKVCKSSCESRRLDVFLEGENGIIGTDHIILAMGPIGQPIVPSCVTSILRTKPTCRVFQWTELDKVIQKNNCKNILVLGGGLTAVQVAQRLANKNMKVTICSRRPLASRHFDLPVQWFDRRKANKCMADFYHLPVQERLYLLKETRGGGSVPPIYMKDLDRLEGLGMLQRVVGSPKVQHPEDCDSSSTTIQVLIGDKQFKFDTIVLACGYKPDCCKSQPLIESILKLNNDMKIFGGFPAVTEDLQIADNIFVAGALGSLNTGPDAANLMGIRRAAQIVANSLDCSLSRLRHKGNIFQNRFDAFWSSSDDDDDSSDDDDEDN